MKVHLIDGTFELFRAYYGAPAASAQDGTEVGAVRGLMWSLLALLGEADVTHVGVAFDHTVESFRNALYDGYKTAEGIEPELLAQFGPAEDAARALGLVVWPMTELEADDALATAAARLERAPEVEQVVICSPDKDLAQCVRGRRVVCRDRVRRKTLDADAVRAKFGVAPRSIPDWLALVGDAADGLPGIPRWGAKSAAAVLAVYETIENIPASDADWRAQVRGARTLAANLAERYDDALLFKRLATLRTDAPLHEGTAALEWRGPDATSLSELAARIGDERIPERAARIARRAGLEAS